MRFRVVIILVVGVVSQRIWHDMNRGVLKDSQSLQFMGRAYFERNKGLYECNDTFVRAAGETSLESYKTSSIDNIVAIFYMTWFSYNVIQERNVRFLLFSVSHYRPFEKSVKVLYIIPKNGETFLFHLLPFQG